MSENKFDMALETLAKMNTAELKALLDYCIGSITETKIVLNQGGDKREYFEECLGLLELFKERLDTTLSLRLWSTFGIDNPRLFIEDRIKQKSKV
ncbi:hypothetical protein [Aquimarina sediminis]|uniref:hypothetical protein n=1 Tax=Aquimarina sediminis TaxID=2070536 RepID=UPI000CA06138|nr:hypothetical protein [Aquimarina sediminis]